MQPANETLDQAALIAALLQPDRYHPVTTVEHLQTHISHVLLAGDYAYKIKNPESGISGFYQPGPKEILL